MSRLLMVPLVPLVLLLALPLAGADAQVAHVQLTPRDSLRNLSEAHDAQFRFESLRRLNLPRLQPSAPQPCDATVGRMCYWDEDDDATEHDSSTIAETAPVLRARRRLVAVLDRLSAIAPGDVWIAGQRVRYLVESGADSTAIEAAHQCRAAAWWCELLNGYALHSTGDYAMSETVFDSALAAMPHDVRCRWNDISLLLGDSERDSYQRLPCDSRHEMEQRFWKLAQPSYAVHGNDRRTEHFSRVLLAELLSSSANAYGLSWGDDMREILIRYGPPLWYAATWPTASIFASGNASGITGHDRNHSYHFAVNGSGEKIHWDTHSKDARERYAPPYMDSLADLSAQFAMLKRGDSAVVIAIYADAAKSDSAVLGLAGDSGTVVVMHDSVHAHVRRARTAWKEVVAGIENYDPVRRIDARARTFITPPRAAPGAPELSTLLLFSGDTTADTGLPDGSANESINGPLEDALAHALTADELGGTRKLGLYWEMYGVNAADSAQENVSISVTRTDGGVLKWLAQALRVTPRDSPLAMQWHEAQISSGVTARSVVLDLSQLPAGTYRIALGVGPAAGNQTVTSRDIRLR
ncbi:MAG: hypothetical protein ACR2MQ_12165 [Gemmatimonadaceae bacterium]